MSAVFVSKCVSCKRTVGYAAPARSTVFTTARLAHSLGRRAKVACNARGPATDDLRASPTAGTSRRI